MHPPARRLLLAAIVFLALNASPGIAADTFAGDQSLLAAARCSSLRQANANLVALLKAVNPFYRNERPLLALFGEKIVNPHLANLAADHWVESVYFNLPNETGWVWVFGVADEKKYVADLLARGDVRREIQELDITRYRLTGGERQTVFYLTFATPVGGHPLAFLGDGQNAVARARALYNNRPDGTLGDARGDFAFAFHNTRFQLNYPRALPDWLESFRQDLVADLAGVTAKPDNPLAVFLAQIMDGWTRAARNFATVAAQISLDDKTVVVAAQTTFQYGGNIHYALSAMPPRASPPPPRAAVFAETVLWAELREQIWEGLGAALRQTFPPEKRDAIAAATARWYELLTAADWRHTAVGVVDGGKSAPALVARLDFGKPELLPELWRETRELAHTGELAEALSETGIKWEIDVDETPEIIAGQNVWRARVGGRAQDFALPGILAETQRYLAAAVDGTLVLVAPAAPLTLNQYRDAEKHLLAVLTGEIAALTAPPSESSPSEERRNESPVKNRDVFFTAAGNPLRAALLALAAEAAYPQKGEPERLPIPWAAIYDEVKDRPAEAAPLTFSAAVQRNSLTVNLSVTFAALAELANAFLDFKEKSR
ncbi:hypothetical protein FACS1894139_08120 [Planctomycetales bacterium]|nr:hypothetical protein FACS1894107_00140 [Planctomycetales bacterium]GHS96280.1 hypothetical protein FACS1894108_00640 [Planctomycetales bacterium]GHT05010.1 hypothetical protein FACS1894139_08120 [Planctomycetales bacterium]